ncbi:MAG TPA: UDP-glucose/GDP-mannose dehydrogenase family protein [Ilumatobacteraceae bacterium]|nr:UDP-glucose/GDP-mannose dehydrogenase family protein [Ilumatobacteraceae bacterium]
MTAPPTSIAIVGTGYVGLTTGACLAQLGHHVTCADIDADKIELLNRGEIPIVEEGLAKVVAAARAAGRLEFVLGAATAAAVADVVFLCVPTPQGEDGSADLSYIQAAATEIGPSLRPDSIIVNKSTVPVGSTRVVERAVRRDDVHVVSNPEFLREGTAVHDFLNPDRVVIGAADRTAAERVAALYDGLDVKILITDPASAETIKYAANGFLAMKISFVNAVAAMCEAVGADVAAVVEGLGSDTRIGPAFLNPGPGWGGSCFPKDSRALVRIAQDHGYNFSMMRGVIEVNDQQRSRMVDKVIRALDGHERSVLSGSRVGVLGLTFKAGTDDLRDSPSIAVIRDLIHFGADISAYDPTVVGSLHPARAAALGGIALCADPYAAAAETDVVVILTEWPEFKELDLDKLATAMAGKAIVDTRNVLDPVAARSAGLVYDGVGRR